MIKKNNLPPIIKEWISNLLDPKIDTGIRENYLFMIEHVRNQCTHAIQQYNIDKYSDSPKKRKAS